MKRKFPIVLAVFLSITLMTSASKLKVYPQLVKGKLSNGLTYYIYPNAYPKGEAVYRLFIKSGSVFETEDQRGLAHFIEHMAFNGTAHFPAGSMIRFLESKGAKFGKDLNAHTSFNETVYKLQLPTSSKSMVDSTFTIMADWANGLLLDSVEIDSERGVILSEWLSKTGPQADVNNALLLDLLNKSHFSDRLVIGDTAVIKHFKQNILRDYYRSWYHPQLMAVAVVGDVNPVEIKKMIEAKFGSFHSEAIHQIPSYQIPNFTEPKAKIIVDKSLNKIELNVYQLLPVSKPVRSEKDYPEYLQRNILNRLMKARLNAYSFNNPPYSNGGAAMSDFLNIKGVFLASAELTPNKIDAGISTFYIHLEQMFRYGFLPIEIEKVKKTYLNQVKRRANSKSPVKSETYMDEIYADFYKGNMMVTPKDEYRLLKKYIQKIDSSSITSYLHQLILPGQTHYLMSAFDKVKKELPSEKSLIEKIDSIRKSEILPYKKTIEMPEKLLEVESKSGKIISKHFIPEIQTEEYQLSNGVTVFYKKSISDKDKVSFSAFRKGGLYALDSTDYVSGLFAGNVVPLSGAGAFTRDALSYYLAGNTASARFLIEKTRSGVVGGANIQDIETLFQLLYLKWTKPNVDSMVFKQTKDMSIESYLTENRTDETKYYRELGYLMKSKDYVTRELTDTIMRDEVLINKMLPVFNQCFGNANGYTFVIMSDTDFEQIEPWVLKYIGGLPSGKVKTDYVYNGGKIRTDKAILEKKCGDSPRAQVSLSFQQTSLPLSLKFYELYSQMITDVLKVKLLGTLREKLGMVYSVSVSSGATLAPSALSRSSISFSCLPQNVDTLVKKTLAIVNEMELSPESFESELNDVKTNLIKVMKVESQKDAFWGTYIRNSVFNKEQDWSFVPDYNHIIQSVTPQQLAKLIPNNFNPDSMIRSVLLPKDKK